MKIKDIQHINVNKIVAILGVEVVCDIILNSRLQGRDHNLIPILRDNPKEFVNYTQNWGASKHHTFKEPTQHTDSYWIRLSDKLIKEFDLQGHLNNEIPLFLFADVFSKREEVLNKKKKFKAWE